MIPETGIPKHLHSGAISMTASLLSSPGTAPFAPAESFMLHEQVCFLKPGNKEEHKENIALSLNAL